VADQWGHPTAAADVATAALAAVVRARDGLVGTFHVAGAPLATWHDLATAAIAEAARAGAITEVPVDPIPTSAYPTAAKRPLRVEMDMADTWPALGLAPFDWRASLAAEAEARFNGGGLS